jgi:hypothetical protein
VFQTEEDLVHLHGPSIALKYLYDRWSQRARWRSGTRTTGQLGRGTVAVLTSRTRRATTGASYLDGISRWSVGIDREFQSISNKGVQLANKSLNSGSDLGGLTNRLGVRDRHDSE